MCYSEVLTKICEACNRPRAFEKLYEHKCFVVLKFEKGFGKCGRKDGPYQSRVVRGFCPDCKHSKELGSI